MSTWHAVAKGPRVLVARLSENRRDSSVERFMTIKRAINNEKANFVVGIGWDDL